MTLKHSRGEILQYFSEKYMINEKNWIIIRISNLSYYNILIINGLHYFCISVGNK